jgi:hypothetical protein
MGLLTNNEQTEYVGIRSKKQELIGLIVCVAVAVFFAWIAKSSWNDFVTMEENGKDLEVDSISYVLYNLGGKLLATSFLWVLSLFFVFHGVKRAIGYGKAEE